MLVQIADLRTKSLLRIKCTTTYDREHAQIFY